MIEMMMNVIGVPVPDSQESISKLLETVKTETLSERIAAILEQTQVLKDLNISIRTLIKALDRNSEQMTLLVTKMQDAFSKLPELVSDFPKASVKGMRGPSSERLSKKRRVDVSTEGVEEALRSASRGG